MAMTGTDPIQTERRRNLQLRAIYAEASGHIDHLFHHRQDWVGSSVDYLAQRKIHETYPHLHGEDVRILVEAIERNRRAQGKLQP